jgi:adenylylsulfate kinase
MGTSIPEFETTGATVEESPPALLPAPQQPVADNAKPKSSNIFWHAGQVSSKFRRRMFGHRAVTTWLTGFSGAGKSTLAYELEKLLIHSGHPCYVLDGDNIRHFLNSDLGFSTDDRKENIRRIAEVARLMNDAGLMVITAFISPTREDREMARAIIGDPNFVEVHLSTNMETCEARDPKGLYAKARAGKIPEFTGISSPYETPLRPMLEIDTGAMSVAEASRKLHSLLAIHFFG